MFERMAKAREIVPWLRPGLSHSDLRRTVARLRSGAIRSIDARIPAARLADILEQSLAKDEFLRWIRSRIDEERQMQRAIEERERQDYDRELAANFHRLKKAPEAADPESPVAEEFQRLHRARRSELGRPRRRKKEAKRPG
jgi:hypothetical protein